MTDEKNRQPNIEVVDIDSLVADDQNFNRGTDEGKQLIARSFKEHGAGRSVLLDKNNRLVAGNKATEVFGVSSRTLYRRMKEFGII